MNVRRVVLSSIKSVTLAWHHVLAYLLGRYKLTMWLCTIIYSEEESRQPSSAFESSSSLRHLPFVSFWMQIITSIVIIDEAKTLRPAHIRETDCKLVIDWLDQLEEIRRLSRLEKSLRLVVINSLQRSIRK